MADVLLDMRCPSYRDRIESLMFLNPPPKQKRLGGGLKGTQRKGMKRAASSSSRSRPPKP